MKFDKTALYINLGVFVAGGSYGAVAAGAFGLGTAAFLVAVLNVPLAIIFHIAGRHPAAQTAWVFLAIWSLVGFSVCSSITLGGLH